MTTEPSSLDPAEASPAEAATQPTETRPAETRPDDETGAEPRHRVRVPGIKQDVGLGDVVARATTRVGIKPCAPCKRRQAALNRWIGFGA